MCQSAEIAENKTNYSLCATNATELFKRGVPEKIVQERTGHRSLDALRTYECSSAEQHKAASAILAMKQTTYQQMISNKTVNINASNHLLGIPESINVAFHSLQNCTINITQLSTPQ